MRTAVKDSQAMEVDIETGLYQTEQNVTLIPMFNSSERPKKSIYTAGQ